MDITGRLKAIGWGCGRADFDDLLVEIMQAYCPDWSDEQLLCRPDQAKEYCTIVRRRAALTGLPDELILRALVNIRRKQEGQR